jgi:Sporulation related domain.
MVRKNINGVLIVFTVLLASVLNLSAQNIFSHLESKNGNAKASVKVHQDQRVESLVYGIKKHPVISTAPAGAVSSATETVSTTEVQGYRVQVYSSNVQRMAKSEAFRVEGELQQLLPDVPVYVTYHSPFWKVRAGNCRSMQEAQQLKSEIGDAYPQVKRDLYVVRDKIKIPAK